MKESGIRNQELRKSRFWRFVFSCLIPYSLFLIPLTSFGQSSFTLTITPPLFQMTVSPGQNWSSSIKVVNNNPYDITVYASVMNFRVRGEGGVGQFVPVDDIANTPGGFELARWFEISSEPIYIRAEKSISVPFSLHVPEDASPGGHYGAILIGTEPPPKTEGSAVRVASQLSSLFLVRVNGDVVEKGSIRSFSTEKMLYQEPRAIFDLRFENKGNVHLLPKGDIVISNMWGKERGRIPINQESDFGNVLPQSVRKFTFEWAGEQNFFDIGRYKAVATLAFGEEDKGIDYRAVYFWIIPVVPVLKIIGFLVLFLWFFIWSVRRYIKNALALETARFGGERLDKGKQLFEPYEKSKLPTPESRTLQPAPLPKLPPRTEAAPTRIDRRVLAEPIVLGAVDLRKAIRPEMSMDAKDAIEKMTLTQFAKKYRLFLIFLVVTLFSIVAISRYFDDVLVRHRNFDVRVMREDVPERK